VSIEPLRPTEARAPRTGRLEVAGLQRQELHQLAAHGLQDVVGAATGRHLLGHPVEAGDLVAPASRLPVPAAGPYDDLTDDQPHREQQDRGDVVVGFVDRQRAVRRGKKSKQMAEMMAAVTPGHRPRGGGGDDHDHEHGAVLASPSRRDAHEQALRRRSADRGDGSPAANGRLPGSLCRSCPRPPAMPPEPVAHAGLGDGSG
jgi:hypothetical protein